MQQLKQLKKNPSHFLLQTVKCYIIVKPWSVNQSLLLLWKGLINNCEGQLKNALLSMNTTDLR